jgi:hypothetical protein
MEKIKRERCWNKMWDCSNRDRERMSRTNVDEGVVLFRLREAV